MKRNSMLPRHTIASDIDASPMMRRALQVRRGSMVEVAEMQVTSNRFRFIPMEAKPAFIVVDKVTGKESEVSIFAYAQLRRILGELFPEDE